jgi:hypothetical protein
MPGLPVEGEDADDSDAPIGEEDFDNMDVSGHEEGEITAEVAAGASSRGSEAAGGKTSASAAGEKSVSEDEDMTS